MNRLAPSSHGSRKSKSPKRPKKVNQQHRSRASSKEETETVSATPAPTPILSITDTCFHCGRETLDGVDRCDCEYLLTEYGALGCSCCGYSYSDLRGHPRSLSKVLKGDVTTMYYPQYGRLMVEPCDKCSPKFVERMRACQKADREDYDAWQEWEHEQRCRDCY